MDSRSKPSNWIKPKFTATRLPSEFTETDDAVQFFLSAGRLIGLLAVRKRTATLLKSHYLVSKCFALFHEDCLCSTVPLLLLDWTFRCCLLRTRVEVEVQQHRPSSCVQSHAFLPGCRQDRRLFSWLDCVKSLRREWENKPKKARNAGS